MGWAFSIALFIMFLETREAAPLIASSLFAIAGAISRIVIEEDTEEEE